MLPSPVGVEVPPTLPSWKGGTNDCIARTENAEYMMDGPIENVLNACGSNESTIRVLLVAGTQRR